MGQSPDSSSYNTNGQGIPFFQGCANFGQLYPNIITYCSSPTKLANAYDILLSVRAPIGTLNIANKTCCIGRGLASIKEIPGKSKYKYLFYYLKHIANDLKDKGTGATFKAINKDILHNCKIHIPSIVIQEKIVKELDIIISIINNKKKQLEELDKLAQAIFYDMFGNPIANEKGWEVKSFGAEFKITSGGTPDTKNKSYWDNGDIPWIGSNMCQNAIIYNTDGKFITQLGLEKSSAKIYSKGYVLVALVGATIGKTALLATDTTTNQNVAGIDVSANGKYNSFYIYFLLQNLYCLFEEIGGDKFKMANLGFVRSLPLISPPLSLQQQFSEKIEAIEKQKALIKKSLEEVETLFNSRMDYYFN